MKPHPWLVAGIAWLAVTTSGCEGQADEPPLQVVTGEAFGTTWNVKWRGEHPSAAEVEPAITAVLDTIDARMSSWRDDSEISQVKHAAGPHPVSEETYEVVLASLELAEATGGAFDPTVEPLMRLWGFRGKRREVPPTEQEITAAMAAVGWNKVALSRGQGGEPRVDAGGTSLDLSAIAKGHAVDRVSGTLAALGATDYLVEIGGEVRAHGTGMEGPWRLGVDTPDQRLAPGAKFAAVVSLRNASMATSGNYRSAYDADGTKVVHTMDPRQGRPHASQVASSTVIAPDCRTADGWATALMVLPPDEGVAAIEARPGIEALLLLATDEGFIERRSSGFADWLYVP